MRKTTAVIVAAALVSIFAGSTAFAFSHSGQSDSQNTVDNAAGIEYNQYSESTYHSNSHSTSGTGCLGGSAYHYDETGHHTGHR